MKRPGGESIVRPQDIYFVDKAIGAMNELFSKFRPSSKIIDPSQTYFDEARVDELFASSKPLQNAVTLIPEDSTIEFPDIRTDQIDSNLLYDDFHSIRVISNQLKTLSFEGGAALGGIYGRKYGEGAAFLGINDGQDPSEPVDVDKIKSVDWMAIRHRYQYSLDHQNEQIIAHFSDTGNPVDFQEATGIYGYSQVSFHYSRVLRFPGNDLHACRYHVRNWGENQSILETLFNAYMLYTSSLINASDMLASHSVFKYGVKGLKNYLKTDSNSGAIKRRFESLLMGLNTIGALIYDPDAEPNPEFVNRTYTGVKDLLEHLQGWLVSASTMPYSKVFGNAPHAAMSEGSEGDARRYNESIARYSNLILKPNYLLLGKYLMAARGISEPKLELIFKPYYKLTAKEEAEIALTLAQVDKIYLEYGVRTPEEIKKERFEGTDHQDT